MKKRYKIKKTPKKLNPPSQHPAKPIKGMQEVKEVGWLYLGALLGGIISSVAFGVAGVANKPSASAGIGVASMVGGGYVLWNAGSLSNGKDTTKMMYYGTSLALVGGGLAIVSMSALQKLVKAKSE